MKPLRYLVAVGVIAIVVSGVVADTVVGVLASVACGLSVLFSVAHFMLSF